MSRARPREERKYSFWFEKPGPQAIKDLFFWVGRTMTIKELAVKSGYSPAYLYSIRDGKRSARFVVIQDIANAVGLEVVLVHKTQENRNE